MKLIEPERYAHNYSPERFQQKLTGVARRVGRKLAYPLLLLYCLLRRGELSMLDKTRVIGTLGYFILPADLVPDFLLGVGYGDDLIAVATLLRQLHKSITPEVKHEAEALLQTYLGKE